MENSSADQVKKIQEIGKSLNTPSQLDKTVMEAVRGQLTDYIDGKNRTGRGSSKRNSKSKPISCRIEKDNFENRYSVSMWKEHKKKGWSAGKLPILSFLGRYLSCGGAQNGAMPSRLKGKENGSGLVYFI